MMKRIALLGFVALLAAAAWWFGWGWRGWPRVEEFATDAALDLEKPFAVVFESAPKSPPGREQRDAALRLPVSTVTQKTHFSPRGDPRDYTSLSIYWWPNPLTGLPWLPRDGRRNPAVEEYDTPRMRQMTRTVRTLAAANDPACDERAREWLNAWFIDSATAMHPHLTFAQMMPGIAAGGRQGIIEGLTLTNELLDAIAWLDARNALPLEERGALRGWFGSYLAWLRHSSPGRAEARRVNNHGTWHDVQVAALARALGMVELERATLEKAEARLQAQFLPDGRQPDELRRTKAFAYSVYNLNAWAHLERLAQRHGMHIWSKGPQRGLDYLQARQKDWPHRDLGSDHARELAPLLQRLQRWNIAPAPPP